MGGSRPSRTTRRCAWRSFGFLWFGWLAMLLGGSWLQVERRGLVIPNWQGVALFAVGLLGALAMPASGFWLVLPVGGVVIWRAWRARSLAAAVSPGN